VNSACTAREFCYISVRKKLDMKTKSLLIFAASTIAASLHATDASDEAGWTTLFNGKDLSNWHHEGEAASVFVATNGVIHVEGGKGWLRTDKEYGDFVLEAEWRGLETNFNSGIFIRASLDGNPWATNVWQVNLKQSAMGELLEGSRKAVLSKTTRPVNEWVKYRIEARGKKLTLFIDDERAWEFDELEPARGYIGLQAEGRAVDFRNVRLQELPANTASTDR
jgi:3-keto-disaccharide hydrolase